MHINKSEFKFEFSPSVNNFDFPTTKKPKIFSDFEIFKI